MTNPLDRYRTGTTTTPPTEAEAYEAYGVISPQPRRLAIRRVKEAYRAPSYDHLVDVVWDGAEGREAALVFSHMVIMLKGRNLKELAEQLVMEKIGWLQEFDPTRWKQPAKDACVIESIECTTRVLAPLEKDGPKDK